MIARRVFALLCCLALMGALPAAAQNKDSFAAAIEELAARAPTAPFDAKASALPEGFPEFLAARGAPDAAFTNKEALELYRRFLAAPSSLGGARKSPPFPQIPRDKLSLPLLPDDAQGLSSIYDGAAGSRKKAAAPARPGIFGLELTAGRDFLIDNNEPFPRLGFRQQAVPLKVSPWLDVGGLGARVAYLRPEPLKSLSVGFLSLVDVPAVLGVDRLRDWAMARFGATALKPRGGFQAAASGAINDKLGGQTSYISERSLQGAQWVDRKRLTIGAGVSLWSSPDKRTKWTGISSLINETYSLSQPGYAKERRGFGYSAGLVFQRALNQSPLPGLMGTANPGRALQFDRLKTSVEAGDSPSTDLTLATSAEVTSLLFNRLELTTGARGTWFSNPDRRDPYARVFKLAAIFGARLRY